MASSREEQLRSNRRLARQITGAVVVMLVIIGVGTVLGWGVKALRGALDDTPRKEEYADRLYGLVMFDPLAFEDAAAVDQSVFKEAAIWGTIYQAQKNGGTLDSYERDEETGGVILPQLELDTYISGLLGPDYKVDEGSFDAGGMNYRYDEQKQGYIIPVTGAVGMYTPVVDSITVRAGKRYVTVGYVPTLSNTGSNDLTLTAPTEPTKYMDYIFSRGEGRQWYLTALQDSEKQAQASVASSSDSVVLSDDPQALVESALNVDGAATEGDSGDATAEEPLQLDGVGEDAPPEEAPAEEAASEEAPAEEAPAEEAPAESEAASQ